MDDHFNKLTAPYKIRRNVQQAYLQQNEEVLDRICAMAEHHPEEVMDFIKENKDVVVECVKYVSGKLRKISFENMCLGMES
jgi:hypothetical protein